MGKNITFKPKTTFIINVLGASPGSRGATAAALCGEISRYLDCQLVGYGGGYSLVAAAQFFGKSDAVVGDGLLLDSVGLQALKVSLDEVIYASFWVTSPDHGDEKRMEETITSLSRATRRDEVLKARVRSCLTVSGSIEERVHNILQHIGNMQNDSLEGSPKTTAQGEETTAGQDTGCSASFSDEPSEAERLRRIQHEAERRRYDQMLSI